MSKNVITSNLPAVSGKLLLALGLFCSIAQPGRSQIVPDTTLPENSTVTPQGNASIITGGTRQGNNLFHSFESFSIPTNSEAFFDNPVEVNNIINRVTGSELSDIDGILRANGAANVFLLNPNGIRFGENARLQIGGSFIGTTADALEFADGGVYSATDPAASPLLSVNVPIGLQWGNKPGAIAHHPGSNLQVQGDRTLASLGGNVAISGGRLAAPNGRIEVGSVAAGASVSIVPADSGFSFDYDRVSNFSDIAISQQGAIDASGAGGGRIQLAGNNISVLDGSQVLGITQGDLNGGGLTVRAADSLSVIGTTPDGSEPSRISTQTQGTGNAGNLTADARRVVVSDGIISAASFNAGNGGNLTVRASDSIALSAGVTDGLPKGLVNATLSSGDAGNLTIETGELTVRDGAQIISGTRSSGNGGNLTIRATESVNAIGLSDDGRLPTTIQSGATLGPEPIQERFGEAAISGNAGNLTVETGRLNLQGGAIVSTGTDGPGQGGNLSIRATESIALSGADPNNFTSLLSDTNGSGAGGDINLETGYLQLQGTALIAATAFATGEGGDIDVRAQQGITAIGTGFESLNLALALALSRQFQLSDRVPGFLTGTQGLAPSGNIILNTDGSLQLFDGAIAFSPTFGAASGGNIDVRALDSVEAAGGALFTTNLSGTGAAGTIAIETNRLTVQDGAIISSATWSDGSGGDIIVNAAELVETRSSRLDSVLPTGIINNSIFGTGEGGDIKIRTRRLVQRNGTLIVTNSGGFLQARIVTLGGPGGDITIDASESVEISGTSDDGSVTSGPGTTTFGPSPAGDLTINTQRFVAEGGAIISSATLGAGDGGTLTVNASESVEVRGTSEITGLPTTLVTSSGRVDIPQVVATGNGGNLNIVTDRLIVEDGATVAVDSLGPGDAGTLEAIANSIQVEDGARLTASTVSGAGGNIRLDTSTLELRRSAQINTDAGNTNGGNIQIAADTIVAFENSDITANALEGRGGRVTISAQGIFGSEFRDRTTPESDITATSQLGSQFSGTVSIETPDVDPTSGLIDLPDTTADSGNTIVRGCAADSGNRFVVVGRGGLPDDPSHALVGRWLWQDWRPVGNPNHGETTSRSPLRPLIEARDWVIDTNGRVRLVANSSQGAIELGAIQCDR